MDSSGMAFAEGSADDWFPLTDGYGVNSLTGSIIYGVFVDPARRVLNNNLRFTVVEKDYPDNYKDAWIIAYDPNNSTKEEAIKIMAEEPMVWNLIETDKTYLVILLRITKKVINPWFNSNRSSWR